MSSFSNFKSEAPKRSEKGMGGISLGVLVLLALRTANCPADTFVFAPTPHGGQTNTLYPFMCQQVGLSSMRYQQVYNQSVFTNGFPYMISSNQIYISTIQIMVGGSSVGCSYSPWAVSNVQINLSTTSKSADGLSSNFVENVGADDTVVFGPARLTGDLGRELIQLSRPFRYDPNLGNLLLDVRVFDSRGATTTPAAYPVVHPKPRRRGPTL